MNMMTLEKKKNQQFGFLAYIEFILLYLKGNFEFSGHVTAS